MGVILTKKAKAQKSRKITPTKISTFTVLLKLQYVFIVKYTQKSYLLETPDEYGFQVVDICFCHSLAVHIFWKDLYEDSITFNSTCLFLMEVWITEGPRVIS